MEADGDAVTSASGPGDDKDGGGGNAPPQRRRRRPRTADAAAAAPSFADLLLPTWLTEGLADAGFLEPSPVQVRHWILWSSADAASQRPSTRKNLSLTNPLPPSLKNLSPGRRHPAGPGRGRPPGPGPVGHG